MTIEQMWQKGNEARRETKALQRKLQTITDTEAPRLQSRLGAKIQERKQLARQMNELFALAKALRDEAKHRHYQEESIEREFVSMNTDLEDD